MRHQIDAVISCAKDATREAREAPIYCLKAGGWCHSSETLDHPVTVCIATFEEREREAVYLFLYTTLLPYHESSRQQHHEITRMIINRGSRGRICEAPQASTGATISIHGQIGSFVRPVSTQRSLVHLSHGAI